MPDLFPIACLDDSVPSETYIDFVSWLFFLIFFLFFIVSAFFFFLRATRPISHRVGRSIGPSVGPSIGLSHFAFLAFLGILRVGNFAFEHAPAQINTAPAQIIIAPAQLITAPAQPPATKVVV